MNFPKMLVMRNSLGGMIWQAYRIENEKERELLSNSARKNGFIVQEEDADYTDETSPGWRNTPEWKDYVAGKPSPRAQGQARVREVLKPIRRDGPYWLGGYENWLVCCFSLRDLDDLHGFTPFACWSECGSKELKQWMVCMKDGRVYVDRLFGSDRRTTYGLEPKPFEEMTYPPHIFDWIKSVVNSYAQTKEVSNPNRTPAPATS